MKASELKEYLESVIEMNGDIDVVVAIEGNLSWSERSIDELQLTGDLGGNKTVWITV